MTSLINRFNNLIAQMGILRKHGSAPPKACLPRKLDIKKMFALDVDDAIWHDDGLDGAEDKEPPPCWLADDAVREGIAALLETDRVREEMERLDKEVEAMLSWLNEEVMDVQRARVKAEGE